MKAIAAEMNLSETAFVQEADGSSSSLTEATSFLMRWFTPAGVEVSLCGHVRAAAS